MTFVVNNSLYMSCGGSEKDRWFNNSTFRTGCSDRLQENAGDVCCLTFFEMIIIKLKMIVHFFSKFKPCDEIDLR